MTDSIDIPTRSTNQALAVESCGYGRDIMSSIETGSVRRCIVNQIGHDVMICHRDMARAVHEQRLVSHITWKVHSRCVRLVDGLVWIVGDSALKCLVSNTTWKAYSSRISLVVDLVWIVDDRAIHEKSWVNHTTWKAYSARVSLIAGLEWINT